MRQRLAAFAPFELLGGDRLPQLVDDDVRRPVDVVASEVLAPEAQPRLPGKCSVAGHDVQLGVVEERVLVQVGRPDRQPRVVDDPDLGVHVDRLRNARLVERAREEALVDVRGHETRELAARVVVAVVRLDRQHDDETELVRRRTAQLLLEDRQDLGRPQELVLEIDERLRAS